MCDTRSLARSRAQVGAAQIGAALRFLAPLPARLRQVTAVPAWDGRRIVGYALLHAAPPHALLRRETLSPPPLSLPRGSAARIYETYDMKL